MLRKRDLTKENKRSVRMERYNMLHFRDIFLLQDIC